MSWCAVVCRTHGFEGRLGSDAWTGSTRTLPYYPDAARLRSGLSVAGAGVAYRRCTPRHLARRSPLQRASSRSGSWIRQRWAVARVDARSHPGVAHGHAPRVGSTQADVIWETVDVLASDMMVVVEARAAWPRKRRSAHRRGPLPWRGGRRIDDPYCSRPAVTLSTIAPSASDRFRRWWWSMRVTAMASSVPVASFPSRATPRPAEAVVRKLRDAG